ncbi:MAG: hypothetical protein BA870_06660 [Desulfuromonadales bacterium C00003094]|jgi:hypothetical protein|nr:MAG: hypothetical protein BA870_06660 [Desulfuromonadales bacterium C00003094]
MLWRYAFKASQLVRYCGWYSNRARGDRRLRTSKADAEAGKDLCLDLTVEVLDVAEENRDTPEWR